MSRIRSIKPEFATDGGMLKLSDSCALFFVLLWTQCDDEGKHKMDLKEVASKLGGRWHQGKVKLYMSCLINSGQLRLNSDSTWVQVTGWSHQRIDKPKQPKVKAQDLQWLSDSESRKALETSGGIHARIGSDRIGSDQGSDLFPVGSTKKLKLLPVVNEPYAPDKELNRQIFETYQEEYLKKYLHEPKRNARLNSLVSQLAKRLGSEAIDVVRFYLNHKKSFYAQQMHDLSLCVKDAEALRIQMLRNIPITEIDVRNYEKNQKDQELLNAIEKGI